MAIGGRLGRRRSTRCPARDPVSALFSESIGRFVLRGRPRRRRVARRAARRAASPCSAPSPTTPMLALARRRRPIAARRPRRTRSERSDREPARRARAARHRAPTAIGDVAFALDLAGAEPRVTLLAELIERPAAARRRRRWSSSPAASATPTRSVPAGCSLSSSSTALGDELRAFVAAGKPVIGICNGFQVLDAHRPAARRLRSATTTSGHFQCGGSACSRRRSRCIWTAGLIDDRSTARSPTARAASRAPRRSRRWRPTDRSRCATSARNPNGSVDDIAGVCDPTGVVLGLMPHPENHVIARQHPGFTATARRGGLGLALFEQACATPRS